MTRNSFLWSFSIFYFSDQITIDWEIILIHFSNNCIKLSAFSDCLIPSSVAVAAKVGDLPYHLFCRHFSEPKDHFGSQLEGVGDTLLARKSCITHYPFFWRCLGRQCEQNFSCRQSSEAYHHLHCLASEQSHPTAFQIKWLSGAKFSFFTAQLNWWDLRWHC